MEVKGPVARSGCLRILALSASSGVFSTMIPHSLEDAIKAFHMTLKKHGELKVDSELTAEHMKYSCAPKPQKRKAVFPKRMRLSVPAPTAMDLNYTMLRNPVHTVFAV